MKFSVTTPLMALFILGLISSTSAQAAHDGKYSKRKYSHGNHGKYVHRNEGDYVEDLDRYRYVHYDDGDRGRYIHQHIPYDGGYGNYEGGHEPFRNPPYDASGLYAYVQKPRNESCLRLLEQYSNTCSDTSLGNPFKSNEYDIKQPSIYLEYGIPEAEYVDASSHQVKQTSVAMGPDPRASTFPGTAYLPVPRPSTEYGPPERRAKSNSSTRQSKGVSPRRSSRIDSISLTTSSGQESKLNFVTKVPDTTRNRITVSERVTTESTKFMTPSIKFSTAAATTKISTTARTTTARITTPRITTPQTTTASSVATTTAATTEAAKLSTEDELYKCRSELQAALLKLSHQDHAKRH